VININGLSIKLLGDPHIGKTFKNGVPLHRRGEREASQMETFRKSFMWNDEFDIHINLGDLFDKPYVPTELILQTAETYLWAAKHRRYTQFIVIAGNHERHKDLEKRSGFDVFKAIVASVPNIRVIEEPEVITFTTNDSRKDLRIGFVPWHPVKTAEEMVRSLNRGIDTLCAHFDIHPLSDPHNMIPTKLMAELGITTYYGGHDHLPRIETRDGVTINVVGSMQPYSHSEDPDERLYVTRDLDTVRADPSRYHDKCLRIELGPGEKLDFDIDCLQLTLKKAGVEEEDISVQMDEFNLDRLLEESLVDIDEGIGMLVRDKYQELRSR